MNVPKEDCGVVYIATGSRSRSEALRSLRSLRQFSPGVPAAVFTDAEGAESELWKEADQAFLIEYPNFGFRDKILPLLDRPYQRTLFLDADTWIRRPLQPLFALLDAVDVAAVPDNWRAGIPVPVPDTFVELNTGVLLLGPSVAVDDMIREWDAYFVEMLGDRDRVVSEAAKQSFHSYPDVPAPTLHDQPAFRRAVWNAMAAGTLRLTSLPDEANVRVWMPGALAAGSQPFVVHTHDKYGDMSAAALEASPYGRVWLPGLGSVSGRLTDVLIIGGRFAGPARVALGILDRFRRAALRITRRNH